MALKTLQSQRLPASASWSRSTVEPLQGRSGQDADRRSEQERRPQQRRAHHTRTSGGGHKRSYRMVDFKRAQGRVVGDVERLEYDPNRTAFIALIKYQDGTSPTSWRRSAWPSAIRSSRAQTVDVKPGNAMPLDRMPVGTIVHNVEMKPGKGGQIARSAGAYVQYVGRDAAGPCLASIG